jgi:hypothetical protein
MANTKKGRQRRGWGGRKIQPPDPWWKKLWGFPAKLGAVMVVALGAIATFGELQPGLVVEPQQHPNHIDKTEIVLKNGGAFDLDDVEVDLQFLWLELPRQVWQTMEREEVFIGEKLSVGPIPKGEQSQIRLPLIMQDHDLIGHLRPQLSINVWQKVGECLHVSFRSFPYLSLRWPPFSKVTRRYGLMADREDTITLSQKRSCNYVESWLREHAISASWKDKTIIRSGRYLHRHQGQGS